MIPDPRDIKLLWISLLMVEEGMYWYVRSVARRSHSLQDFKIDTIKFKQKFNLEERLPYAM